MKNNSVFCKYISLLLALCLVLSGCASAKKPAETVPTETAAAELQQETSAATTAAEPAETEAAVEAAAAEGQQTLSVAVYPYIPNMQLFQDILTQQWEALEPDVELVYVEWDCYEEPEPGQIDVIMYDAMFTSYLAETNHIQPIQMEDVLDKDGILPFAVEGAHHDGELYGIPYLVCSDFLFHFSDDEEMAAIQNMAQLCEEISARKQENADDGLVVNYYSHYPYFYLDALIDFSGNYTVFEEIPDTTTPDPAVYEQLGRVKQSLPAAYDQDFIQRDTRRCEIFNDGLCSAYYGYSEDLSRMDDIQDRVTVRTISFSEKENIQMFFADVASMGSHVTDPAEQELCIRLMNLLASEEFQQALCFGTEDVQYMLPARKSVYAPAMEKYPVYGQLYELVIDENNRIARFGVGIHDYLAVAYEDLA